MPLLGRIVNNSLPDYVIFFGLAVVLAVVAVLLQGRKRAQQLNALGSKAAAYPAKLPFGVDVLYKLVRHMLQDTFFDFTRELLDNAGRTVELNVPGGRLLFTDNVDNIKAIQFTQFGDFGKGERTHRIWKNILGDSVFSTDGPLWVKNKDELRPHLAKSRSNDLEITEKHTQRLFDHFRQAKPLEVYDVIDRHQLDIVTDIFYGESTNSLVDNEQPFRDAMDTMLRLASVRTILGPLASLFPDWIFARKAYRELNAYMNTRVDRTLALPREDLLKKEQKMNLMETLAVKQPDRKYIKDQLIAVLLASKDPVAITISWLIYELSRRRDVFEKIEREIQETIGFKNHPDGETLKNLPTLKNAVKETLRLYHPLGLNIREAKADTCLPTGGGTDGQQPIGVLKGEQVAYAVMSSQRREAVMGFADVDTWDPSRWESWTPTSSQYLPFNIGPRICLGRVFGHLQMEYTVARMVQEFERIEWCGYAGAAPDDEPMRIKIELNTKFDKPIMCKFTQRSTV
ncbi:hypothetical protein EKO04_005147 [Ascochyta lentis]|uniref:Cytochrome P450 n=1 Tax=Ascochyta lentis TaxID=205686 RepID=A0A8H7MKF4_9PLEO|nr:hypothetical protein EKO04_005147 [Ascochyta lentis]